MKIPAQPVSAKVLSNTLNGAGQPRSAPSRSMRATLNSTTNDNDEPRRPRFFNVFPFSRRQNAIPPSPSPTTTDISEQTTPEAPPTYEDAELQVSVLIAMPSQFRPHSWSLDPNAKGKERMSSMESVGEDELPDVVFGVTEVPWRIRTSPPAS